jgi:hypothetical protein
MAAGGGGAGGDGGVSGSYSGAIGYGGPGRNKRDIAAAKNVSGIPTVFATGGAGKGSAAGLPNTGNGGAGGAGGVTELSGYGGGSGIVIVRFRYVPPST